MTRWIAIVALLLGGCETPLVNSVPDEPTRQEVGEPPQQKATVDAATATPPVELDEIVFVPTELGDQVRLLDQFTRGLNLPKENETPWGYDLQSIGMEDEFVRYAACWSSHKDLSGMRPRLEDQLVVSVYMEIWSSTAGAKSVNKFDMNAASRPHGEGWRVSIQVKHFGCLPNRTTYIVTFIHTSGRRSFAYPNSERPFETTRLPPLARGRRTIGELKITLHRQAEVPNLEQMQALTASADSFLHEAKRNLDKYESDCLADIVASRGIVLGILKIVDSEGNNDYERIDVPDDFELTASEKEKLAKIVHDVVGLRRNVLETNYEQMYKAMLRTFPLTEYFAALAEIEVQRQTSISNETP